MKSHLITFDRLPPTVQMRRRGNYALYKYAQERKLARESIQEQLRGVTVDSPVVEVLYSFRLKRNNRDLDNLVAGCKSWIDEIFSHIGQNDVKVELINAHKMGGTEDHTSIIIKWRTKL